jgi:16S rRNA (cytosine1402-N4)-methyltransferase
MQGAEDTPHIPVLLRPILQHLAPISGVWLDGTLGAGGYARALWRQGRSR